MKVIRDMLKDNHSDKRINAQKIFMENIELVRQCAFRNAPDRQLTGDIVNDVFIQFVEKAEQWDYSRDFRPLLNKITTHISLQYWRIHLKSLSDSEAAIASYAMKRQEKSGNDSISQAMKLRALDLCMEGLSLENRILLEAHYIKGISIVDLAKEYGRNLNALYSFFTRIRNSLQKCVEEKLKGESIHVEP